MVVSLLRGPHHWARKRQCSSHYPRFPFHITWTFKSKLCQSQHLKQYQCTAAIPAQVIQWWGQTPWGNSSPNHHPPLGKALHRRIQIPLPSSSKSASHPHCLLTGEVCEEPTNDPAKDFQQLVQREEEQGPCPCSCSSHAATREGGLHTVAECWDLGQSLACHLLLPESSWTLTLSISHRATVRIRRDDRKYLAQFPLLPLCIQKHTLSPLVFFTQMRTIQAVSHLAFFIDQHTLQPSNV